MIVGAGVGVGVGPWLVGAAGVGVAIAVELGVAVTVGRGEWEMYKGASGVVTDKYLVTIMTLATIAAIPMPRVNVVFIR
jgi:hypothetical protein